MLEVSHRQELEERLQDLEGIIRRESLCEGRRCSTLDTAEWKAFRLSALQWARGFSESFPGKCYLPRDMGVVSLFSDRLVYRLYQPEARGVHKRKAMDTEDD